MKWRKLVIAITILSFFVFQLSAFAATKSNTSFFTLKTSKYGKIGCYKEGDSYKSGKVKNKKTIKPLSADLKKLQSKLAKAKKSGKQKKIDRINNDILNLQNKMSAQSELCRQYKEGSEIPTPDPLPLPDNSLEENSLLPLERALSKDDLQTLLEKAGFGLGPRDEYLVNIALNQGVNALVEEFLRNKSEDDGLITRVEDLFDREIGNDTTQSASGQRQGLLELWTHTNNPYAEKLAIFLLSVWTVSGDVIEDETFRYLWWEYFQRLRNSAANDTDLVSLGIEITRDPLMLIYLNNELNVKGKPNENYARELMELFTLGPTNLSGSINYTETNPDGTGDIATAAKILTGWKVRKAWEPPSVQAIFEQRRHEPGPHTMFAGTAHAFSAENEEDLVRGIFSRHPNTAIYYAKEILQYYLTPNPSRTLIENLSIVIRENSFKLRPVLKILFNSKAFYHSKYKNTLQKDSVEFAVETIRLLKLENAFDQNEAERKLSNMGMEINNPPSVFWFNPSSWTGPSILLERANFLAQLFGDSSAQQKITPRWSPALVLPVGNISAEDVIVSLATYLGIKEVNINSKQQLLTYLNKVKQSNGNYRSVAYNNTNTSHQRNKGGGLIYVLTAMPDYQLK